MRAGRISNSRTRTPRRASCQAASLPARPAPITLTIGGLTGGSERRLACSPARGQAWPQTQLKMLVPPAPQDNLSRSRACRSRACGGWCGRAAVGRGGWHRHAVIAFLIGALPACALALGHLLDQVGRAALRAGLRHDLVPARELALGVARASEEQLAATAAPLQHVALLAIGTVDARADRVR